MLKNIKNKLRLGKVVHYYDVDRGWSGAKEPRPGCEKSNFVLTLKVSVFVVLDDRHKKVQILF
jgi:hypothetical protein